MITPEEIRRLEESSDKPIIVLMENAGRLVYETIKQKQDISNKKILIVCNHGNNGGDGLVTARHLCDESEVDVLFIGEESKMSKETLSNYKKVENNERIQMLEEESVDFNSYDIIIDAIFGLGFKGTLSDEIKSLIEKINESSAFKVSIDIPSGLEINQQPDHVSVQPDLIVTFHDLKPNLQPLKDITVIVDVGL